MDFGRLSKHTREDKKLPPIVGEERLLSFDPGHTTGWAFFVGITLVEAGEIDTTSIPLATNTITELLDSYLPNAVVIEDYRIYKWRAKHHAGSNLLTARVIGCIETLSSMSLIADVFKQPANIAKGFCTDTKLKEWGYYRKGLKHARDATRHGCYFLMFGPIKQSDRDKVGTTVG